MDYLKKLVNFGFGAWALTREKVENLVNDMVKRGEVSADEYKKVVDELVDKLQASKTEIEGKIEQIVKDVLKKLDIPTRSEVDELKAELDAVNKELKKCSAEKDAEKKPEEKKKS